MRGGLAGQDEVAAAPLDGGGDRLASEEVVAEIDRPVAGDCRSVFGEPALGGIAFAVLLLGAVLRDDELGRQRQNLLVARSHDAGTEKAVEIFGPAVRSAARGALRAMDLARAVVLGPVQRDQHPPAQTLERRQRIGGGDGLHSLEVQPVEFGRGGAIEHQPHVIVAGNCRCPEQRLAVRAAMPLFQSSLVGQKRRATHEKQRERRHADIGHRVPALLHRPLAPVGKTGADRPQLGNVAFKHAHAAVESRPNPARKPEVATSGVTPHKILPPVTNPTH